MSAAIRKNAASVSGKDGMTTYGRLAGEFWNRIATGEWPPGKRLPTVVELGVIYGVSPVTIRGALRLLVEQGLIHSRQGRGTFVLERPTAGPTGDTLGESYFEAWIVGPEESVRVLDRHEGVPLPIELAEGFMIMPQYVHLRRLHISGAIPVCLVDFYVCDEAYKSLPLGVDEGFKIGLLLMTKAVPRPARGRQVTMVVVATAEDAELLKNACWLSCREREAIFRR